MLKEWVEAPSLEPYRKIDGRQVVTAAIATLERYTPTDAAREDYLASYAGDRFAESMRYVRTYPEQLPVLRDLLPKIQTPVQIIAARETPWCRGSTPSSSTSGCPRASSTSSTPCTSSGKMRPTSTRLW